MKTAYIAWSALAFLWTAKGDNPNLPVIQSATATGKQITSTGSAFGTPAPTVHLEGTALSVSLFTDTTVVALLPSPSLPGGSYGLDLTPAGSPSKTASFIVTIGAVGPQGPQGSAGAQGSPGSLGPPGPPDPQGPPGPPGSAGSGGFSGIREFTQTGSFTVPAGVNHVYAELWGAGGGPMGIICLVLSDSNNVGVALGGNGGGGGSGGYTRAVIPVTPGATYNIVAGAGGTGGIAPLPQSVVLANTGCSNMSQTPATAGGASQVTDTLLMNVLASASGGGAGGPGGNGTRDVLSCLVPITGPTGTPGSGGQAISGTNLVGRNGNRGQGLNGGSALSAGSIGLPSGGISVGGVGEF